MVETNGRNPVRGSKSPKLYLSMDRGLQPALVKLESLVTVDQKSTVNESLLLAHTARQATRVGFG